MITYLKCPNCSGIISAHGNEKIVQCATCGKKYVNPNFRDLSTVQFQESVEKKVNCKNCGKSVSESFEFCPYCGAQLKARCRKCGNALRNEDLFCSHCGTPTKESEVKNELFDNEQTENADIAQDAAVADIEEKNQHMFEYGDAQKPNKKVKTPKYSKKAVLAVVKNAICLTLCILLFAFAFCPVIRLGIDSDIEISGVDFIDMMGATSKKYDRETDANKLEKWQKEIGELQEDLKGADRTYYINERAAVKYNLEYKRLQHKIGIENYKYELAIKDNTSGAMLAQVCFAGVISLICIILAAAMVVMSTIALVFSIINMCSNGKKELKFWNGYFNLSVIFLFLSIALLFVLMTYVGFISLTLIFRLLFECIAVAFVMADTLSEKGTRRQGIFKVAALALCIIVVGVCFAPCFSTTKTETYTTTVNGKERTVEYEVSTKDAALVFMSSSISKEDYDYSYKDKTHEDYLYDVKVAINLQGEYYYNLLGISRTTEIVKNVYFDEEFYTSTQTLSAGYFVMVLAMLMVGVYACLAQFANNGCAVARRVVLIFALLMFVVAIILGGVMCGKVNGYMDDNDIINFKMTIGAGLICALIFGVATTVCEFLPNAIDKKQIKKNQFVQVQE